MAIGTIRLTLDTFAYNHIPEIVVVQGDYKARFIEAVITAKGVAIPVSPTPNTTVTINSLRPDGKTGSYTGSVNDDGSVCVPLTGGMSEIIGRVKCNISVVDGITSEKISTTHFYIQVQESPYDPSNVPDADPDKVDIITETYGMIKSLDVKADWNQESQDSVSYIKNKPSIKAGTGTRAIVEGRITGDGANLASGNWSHAEGYNTQATNQMAHAEGGDTVASGSASHAEGGGTKATAQYSHAEGRGTVANSSNQHVQGKFNDLTDSSKYAHIVGNGTGEDELNADGTIKTKKRSNAHTLDWSGNAWFAGDITIGADKKKLLVEVEGKQLSTNDYTTNEKNKLKGIAAGAEVNVQSDWNESSNTNDAFIKNKPSIKTGTAEGSIIEGLLTKQTLNGYTFEANQANSMGAHAEGAGTKASGIGSHAEGGKTQATETGAHAEGSESKAKGVASHAEGYLTEATGESSHAEGAQTFATGSRAHSEGNETHANGENSHAEGYGSTVDETAKNGHAEGMNTQVKAAHGHAEGNNAKVYAENAHAEGNLTEAHGVSSHAEGKDTSTAENATAAHAEGVGTIALYSGSHSEGLNTTAGDANATDLSKTGGEHAEGSGTVASGKASHAEGQGCDAIGAMSHAEGRDTEAHGNFSHTEGRDTVARGEYSHAEGRGTETSEAALYQHVQGKYNAVDESGEYAHIVGNGKSKTARSNAHTLDWNGNAWFSGEVRVGGTCFEDGKPVGAGGAGGAGTKVRIFNEDPEGYGVACFADSLNPNEELRITIPAYWVEITSFIPSDDINIADSWSIVFTLESSPRGEEPSVIIPDNVVWAVAEPVFTPEYSYMISFVPCGDKIVGIWTEVR